MPTSRLLRNFSRQLKKTWFVFIILVVFSPGLLQLSLHFKEALTLWRGLPRQIVVSTRAKLQDPYQERLVEMRWGNFQLHREDLLSKVLYSKLILLEKYFIDWIQFASPRLYFLTGDGSIFSPGYVEPIPALLLPFWLMGLGILIKKHNYLPLIAVGLFTGLAFFSGIKNMPLIWPVLLIYLYISALGLTGMKDHHRYFLIASLVVIYSIYCFDMTLYAR